MYALLRALKSIASCKSTFGERVDSTAWMCDLGRLKNVRVVVVRVSAICAKTPLHIVIICNSYLHFTIRWNRLKPLTSTVTRLHANSAR
jgi:hypothetical protein